MAIEELEIDDRQFQLMIDEGLKLTAVEASVVTSGLPENYALVLEYGSGEGQRLWPRSGPRTRRAQGRIFSRQAIGGYVRRNAKILNRFLENAYKKVAARGDGSPSQSDLADAVNEAAGEALEFLKKVVPVDSGELRDSLEVRKAK
jgi:hypothetical protein